MEELPPSLTVNEGVATDGDTPTTCAATTNQPSAVASAAPSAGGAALPPVSRDAPVIGQQLSDDQKVSSEQTQQFDHQQNKELQAFWSKQLAEIVRTTEFKKHNLPLGRIKKIMKEDEDVKWIAGEATVVFAKACEIFIQELTLRGWRHAKEDKRRTLQKNDITAAIGRSEVLDFLVPSDSEDSDQQKGASVAVPSTTAVQDDDDPNANVIASEALRM